MHFTFQRTYRGPLKAIIFDWAGTTVDYGSRAPAMVFVEVFKQQGIDITIAEAREPMGMNKKDHIRVITQMAAVSSRWQTALGRLPNEADVDQMYQAFIPLQVDALVNYADLIPGTLDTCTDCKQRGMKIGSNTGYNREMVEVVAAEAAKHGYIPDSIVCSTDVPAGRPTPWMSIMNAMEMGVYPFEAIVKVDDTTPGIVEGLNAGMWTIGIAKTGNELGLSQAGIDQLAPDVLQAKLAQAYQRMYQAGAHYVVDGVGDIPAILDDINARLARGERP